MNKPDKHIKNWIQEKYETSTHAMDEAYLQNMSAQLDAFNQKKKKRRFVWFFLLGFGSLALVGTVAFGLYSKLSNKPQQIVSQNQETPPQNLVEENCEQLTSVDLATSTSQLQKPLSYLEETEQSAPSNQKIVQVNKNSALQISKNSSLNGKVSLSPNGNILQKENSVINKAESGKVLIDFEDNNETIPIENSKETNESEVSKQEASQKDFTQSNSLSSSKTIENLVAFKNFKLDSSTTENPALPNKIEASDTLQKDTVYTEKKQEKTKAKGTWSLVVQAGPDALFRSYASSTQNEKRTTEEKNKISGSIHLELRKTFSNHIYIGSGLRYTNYGEKIAYSPIETQYRDSVPNVAAYDYFNLNIQSTPQGIQFDTTSIVYIDTTFNVVDSIYENKSIQAANGKTSFHFIEIPLYVGYTFFEKNAWSLSANTGFSVGFLVKNKGSYLQINNELAAVDNKKINFNYLFSAQVSYTILDKWSLHISPQFKYPLNNQSTLPSTQRKYIVGGIQAGFQYKF